MAWSHRARAKARAGRAKHRATKHGHAAKRHSKGVHHKHPLHKTIHRKKK